MFGSNPTNHNRSSIATTCIAYANANANAEKNHNLNYLKGHDLINNVEGLCNDIEQTLNFKDHPLLAEAKEQWVLVKRLANELNNDRPQFAVEQKELNRKYDQNSINYGACIKLFNVYLIELHSLHQHKSWNEIANEKIRPTDIKKFENIVTHYEISVLKMVGSLSAAYFDQDVLDFHLKQNNDKLNKNINTFRGNVKRFFCLLNSFFHIYLSRGFFVIFDTPLGWKEGDKNQLTSPLHDNILSACEETINNTSSNSMSLNIQFIVNQFLYTLTPDKIAVPIKKITISDDDTILKSSILKL